jgi:hypothetical protein
MGKEDPQLFGLDLDIAEPIPQIAARVAAEKSTSPIQTSQKSPSAITTHSANQPTPTSPPRSDGDPTSIPPDFIPITISLFCYPSALDDSNEHRHALST